MSRKANENLIRWEYKFVRLEKRYTSTFDGSKPIELEDALKALGSEGWELVSMNTYLIFELVFKRPISESGYMFVGLEGRELELAAKTIAEEIRKAAELLD